MARRIAKSAYLLAAEARDRTTPSLEIYIDFGYVRRLAALARKVFVFRVVVTNCSDAQNSLKTIRPLDSISKSDHDAISIANHSSSFDQRRLPETFFTAMATALRCPTSTTSRLPRVIPV